MDEISVTLGIALLFLSKQIQVEEVSKGRENAFLYMPPVTVD